MGVPYYQEVQAPVVLPEEQLERAYNRLTMVRANSLRGVSEVGTTVISNEDNLKGLVESAERTYAHYEDQFSFPELAWRIREAKMFLGVSIDLSE